MTALYPVLKIPEKPFAGLTVKKLLEAMYQKSLKPVINLL